MPYLHSQLPHYSVRVAAGWTQRRVYEAFVPSMLPVLHGQVPVLP